jgi:hypothetical protein
MNWMPPTFASRNNACVMPAVASPTRSFAVVEPATPNPIALPSTSLVTSRSAWASYPRLIDLAAVGSGSVVLGARRDKVGDSSVVTRVSIYVKY